ncbi:diaminopimelate decarboxylase family protein [Haliangium ochraceum]|uniref:Orn/DAP/Arg decarboxylase 2 n=1 Tax=Haliangium ochraceum (strain DSM 14365 / JCM 11303 / SMP-2) TaxID=502025 RepID=D0LSL3_HALO1|nr:alanine racemase [Haliangium ochraceum]ACY17235.1 Orn/DAP/Arg decarboxylase 2 [Haliangium ochraceum DSM 14365]
MPIHENSPPIPPGATSSATLETWSRELDFRALLARFGSNVWVLHECALRDNFAAWRELAGAAERICYPVKTNPSPAVLERIAAWGGRAECASLAELQLARLAGFSEQRLLYGSPALNLQVAWSLLEDGGTVVVDSAEALASLDERASRAPALPPGRVLLRVNPSISIRYRKTQPWTDLIAHASQRGKFGIPSEEIIELVSGLRALRICGLHAHVGTQMDHIEPFAILAEHLIALADAITERSAQPLSILDLGGGLGIPCTAAEDFPRIAALAPVTEMVANSGREAWLEPGSAMVGNTVGLLAAIASVKTMRDRRWAIADAGTDQLVKITLSQWYHQILGPDGQPLPMQGDDALGGPLCFSGDVLLPATEVSGLRPGDPIFVQHTGAYFAAIANRFNGRRPGGTVVIRADGSAERIHRRARALDEPANDGYAWGCSQPRQRERPVALARIEPLRSVLHSTAGAERFDYLSCAQRGERCCVFEVAIASPLEFLTLPLAMRAAADASIIALLLLLGHEVKSMPVSGSEIEMRIHETISTRAPLRIEVAMSHFAKARGSARSCAMHFYIAEGACTGRSVVQFDPGS